MRSRLRVRHRRFPRISAAAAVKDRLQTSTFTRRAKWCVRRAPGESKPASTLRRRYLYSKPPLFGAGAGLAGAVLYAVVAIMTGLEIGLLSILVGIMVGKAVRHGSGVLGGRPQQILAVAITYFAITTSYIPVFIYNIAKHPPGTAQKGTKSGPTAQGQNSAGLARPDSGRMRSTSPRPKMSVLFVLTYILVLAPIWK